MTHPTKALCPILLEDYRKITVDRKGESNFFTSDMIRRSMGKATALAVHESLFLAPDFEVRPYYAGHVLGAAMFYVRVGTQSVVYTGDYNMTPDRHLGAAWIDRCRPDVLITESTYATTIRESKRARERDFLHKVHRAVAGGGKVLIPVFALGRVQELCVLIESYWERNSLGAIPVYFSAGMAETATAYYKQHLEWTNESIQRIAHDGRNPFDYQFIRPWEKHLAEIPGPMVLFSTPGMLHSGTSLDVFRKWCSEPRNMVIIPGYCVAGTVGAKVLAGQKTIELDPQTTLAVNLQVENLSFSAHADAKGILQLIKNCEPRTVVLVHGDTAKMVPLRDLIKRQFRIPCYMPANGEMLHIAGRGVVPVDVSNGLIAERLAEVAAYARGAAGEGRLLGCAKKRSSPLELTGLLRWTPEDMERGVPPRIERADSSSGSGTLHIHMGLRSAVPVGLLAAAVQAAVDADCILVEQREDRICVRDAVTILWAPQRLTVACAHSESDFGQRIAKDLACSPALAPHLQPEEGTFV